MTQKTLTTTFLVVLGLLVVAVLYVWKTEVNWVPADETNTWDTASSSIAEFKYPDDLDTNYVVPADWPPRIGVADAPYACDTTNPNIEERKVFGTLFCVTTTTEGAAGSIYTDYIYTYGEKEKTISLSFSTRTSQCENYDGSRRERCIEEQDEFNMDSFVARIKKTLVIK